MELVTIKIDLSRSEPVEIRRSEAEKVTRAYVHPAEGVAVQTKRLFRPLMLGPASGLYSLISGDRYATDDEIRLGVEALLGELRKQLQTCWDMEARIREEWLGEVDE